MVKACELVVEELGVGAIVGNGELEVSRATGLDHAGPGALTFVKAATIREAPSWLCERISAAAVVCLPSLAEELNSHTNVALLLSDQPRLSFMKIVSHFFPPARPAAGIHPSAVIDRAAEVHGDASIGAFCFIGPGCCVGPGTVLHPSVVLQADVRIGANVVIHAGTVIGADGFGYERGVDGTMAKFPHLGGVIIEDDVEIGSNTSIDRGSLGDTILHRGCKIDNQIHIAHNVIVGEDAVVIAQAMIGGSVRVGARAWIAPGAVILNQVSVGADALVGLGAVVTKDVYPGATVLGSPAIPEGEFKANRAALKRLLREGS